jgi:hypothetical protein
VSAASKGPAPTVGSPAAEEALADVKSAIAFHIETFGEEVIEGEAPVLEAFVAEAGVAV